MKRVLFFITVSIILNFASTLSAQRTGGVAVKLNRADLKGNALNLIIDVKISQIQIRRYESLSITFVLKGTGRGQTQTLPPVIVNGSNKRHMFERAVALYGETVAKNGAYVVLKNDPELTQFIEYKRAVAYKSWMNNCQLILVGEIKDYNNNIIRRFTNVLEKRIAIRRSTTNSPNTINIPPATNPTTNRSSIPTTNRRPTTGSSTTTNRSAGTTTNRSAGTTTKRPAGTTTNRVGSSATNRPAGTATNRPTGTATNRSTRTTSQSPASSTNRK
jgi:hypothetical protein